MDATEVAGLAALVQDTYGDAALDTGLHLIGAVGIGTTLGGRSQHPDQRAPGRGAAVERRLISLGSPSHRA